MRFLALLLFVSLSAYAGQGMAPLSAGITYSGGGGGLSFVAKAAANANGNGTPVATTSSQSVTSGDVLVAFVSSNAFAAGPSVTDSQGNTWTKQTTGSVPIDVSTVISLWTATASATGSMTVTAQAGPASSVFVNVGWGEITGSLTTSLDGTPATSTGTFTSPSTNPPVANIPDTTVTTGLVLGCMTWENAVATGAQGSGWTLESSISTLTNVSAAALVIVSRNPGSAGAFDPTFTLTSSDDWAAAGAAFKP